MIKKNTHPLFYEKSSSGESYSDVATKLAKERVIFLNEDVTQESSSMITSLLYLMDKDKDDEPIEFWINTDGGDIDAFFAIYDMMQLVKSDIKTICIGKAYSAGAFLLSAGTKGQRFCTTNSSVMIHQIQIAGIGGTGSDVAIEAKEIKKINDKLIELLARHSGQYTSRVRRDIERDLYLDAESALNYGIIDKIMTPSKKIPELKKKAKGRSTKPDTDE